MRRFAQTTGIALALTLAGACAPGGDTDSDATGEQDAAADTGAIIEPREGGLDSPPWQAALARGVDFRAVGQEPGWTLDIDRDGMLIYAGDYGADTLAAPTPEPGREVLDQTWAVTADGRELNVIVRQRECTDVMSGEAFTHEVEVNVDGASLDGCGRWLREQ